MHACKAHSRKVGSTECALRIPTLAVTRKAVCTTAHTVGLTPPGDLQTCKPCLEAGRRFSLAQADTPCDPMTRSQRTNESAEAKQPDA